MSARARQPRPAPVARQLPPEGMPLSERAALCGMPCTLNGEPGAIVGPHGAFATIVDTRTGRAESFGWFTARRIVMTGGAFRVDGVHVPLVPTSAPSEQRMPPGYERFTRAASQPFRVA